MEQGIVGFVRMVHCGEVILVVLWISFDFNDNDFLSNDI